MGVATWTLKKGASGTGRIAKRVVTKPFRSKEAPKQISKLGATKGAGKGAAKGGLAGGPVGAAGGAVYGGVRESGNVPLAAKRVAVDAPIKAGGWVWTGQRGIRKGAALAHRKMYD